jgi:Dolichyl-phosphate-mannose-protein mannosyltransferase
MNELTEGGSQSTVLLTDHPPRTTSSGYQRWMLLGVFVIAALLWIGVAGRSGLWVDEVFSLAMATGHSLEHPAAAADATQGDFVEPDHAVPAEEFRRYLKHDNPPASPGRVVRAVLLSDTSPPLYYLLLYSWTLIFGTSDIVLRMFSIACSLACLPLLVAIARRTGGKGAVFASCVLFVCSPLSIYYSTEGRMYSLLWLCVLATTWASLVLQQRGGGVGMYALWIVASAAGFLTHYFFVFPWLAIVAYLLIRPGKVARTRLVACLLLLAVLILPWYARVPESLASWRITKDWLKWQPRGFDRLAASRDLVLQFFSWRNKLWPDHRTTNIAALILFGFVAVAMVWRLRAQVFSQSRLLLWLLFVATCTGPLVFDFLRHSYTMAVPRYAIAALPAAYLLAGAGLACLGQRTRVIVLVPIVLAWSPNVLSIYHDRSRNWQPIREVSHSVCANSSSSDLILIHSIPSGVLGIARYADGPAELASWVGQLRTRRVPESIHKLAAGRTRILFVRMHEVREPAPEEDWLRANAVVSHETRLGSARIIDFRPLHAETF